MEEIKDILEQVKDGAISIQQAESLLRKDTYEDIGHAKIDTTRKERTGFAEVVYCPNKPDPDLQQIFERIYQQQGEVLGTRATAHQYEIVRKGLPDIQYDPLSGVLKLEKEKERIGNITICTAGTSDIPVAEEAALTAEFFGAHVVRLYDVGVSGIHRILSNRGLLEKANCVITVAGMEEALASVVGGLVSVPVIAVPTSVGYGASFHGLSALLTMINSCANGVSVVNIDNGYGAGYIACQINRLACRGNADGKR